MANTKFLHRFRTSYLTPSCLIALVLGVLFGYLAHVGWSDLVRSMATAVKPIVDIWILALKLVVLPLITAYLVVSISATRSLTNIGRIGGVALLSHASHLVLGLCLSLSLTPLLLSGLSPAPEVMDALAPSVNASGSIGGDAVDPTLWDRIAGSISNAVNDSLVPLLLVSILFSFALFAIGTRRQERIIGIFRTIARRVQTVINWLLLLLPLVVFVYAFGLAAKTGLELAGVIGYYLIIVISLLVLMTIALYAVAAVVGKTPLRRFAEAAAPSQALAVGSRSSLVCLPTLVEAARNRLRLPEPICEFVLPLMAPTLKLNRVVSSPAKVLFLAHIYGIALEPIVIAGFVLGVLLIGMSTPGIPSGSFLVGLPLYLAAGIPVEGYLLVKVVDAIPDIFKTVLNVTEDLTIATVVARFMPSAATFDSSMTPVVEATI